MIRESFGSLGLKELCSRFHLEAGDFYGFYFGNTGFQLRRGNIAFQVTGGIKYPHVTFRNIRGDKSLHKFEYVVFWVPGKRRVEEVFYVKHVTEIDKMIRRFPNIARQITIQTSPSDKRKQREVSEWLRSNPLEPRHFVAELKRLTKLPAIGRNGFSSR